MRGNSGHSKGDVGETPGTRRIHGGPRPRITTTDAVRPQTVPMTPGSHGRHGWRDTRQMVTLNDRNRVTGPANKPVGSGTLPILLRSGPWFDSTQRDQARVTEIWKTYSPQKRVLAGSSPASGTSPSIPMEEEADLKPAQSRFESEEGHKPS